MKTHDRGKPDHRHLLASRVPHPPPPAPFTYKPTSADNEKEQEDALILILEPTGWLIRFITFQLEAIFSLLLDLLSMVYESLHRTREAKQSAEEAVKAVPARVARGSGLVLRKLGLGIVGASRACLILVLVLAVAVSVGMGLVRWWAEEPVFLRKPLLFDYTEVHPSAAVTVGGGRKMQALPIGHTLHIIVWLLMPESDYNRRIGVFQLTAEAISATGVVLAKSSQPCMMRFRSLPVRLIRTLVMAIPLLLGISCETQEVRVPILSYKEGHPRTQTIRVHLKARASTGTIPELYTAEMILNSQLPWSKELVYNWKWTFYVWASIYIYISFLIILLCFMRPVIFPMLGGHEILATGQPACECKDERLEMGKGGERTERFSDVLRRWRQRRRKRKALLLSRVLHDIVDEGSASTSTVTREETGEDFNDSSELGALESELSST